MEKAKEYALGRRDRINEQLTNYSTMEFIVLKAHLLAEEMIDNMIAKALKRPKFYYDSRLRFSEKVNLLGALIEDDFVDRAIEPLEALNALRNELAHNLESSKLEKKVHKFCDAMFVNTDIEPLETRLNHSIVGVMAWMNACELLIVKDDLSKSEKIEIMESLKY